MTNMFVRILRFAALTGAVALLPFQDSAAQGSGGSVPSGESSFPTLLAAYKISTLSDVDVRDAKTAINIWIERILKKRGTHMQVELFSYDDLPSLDRLLKEKKIDLIFFYPEDYLSQSHHYPFEPVAITAASSDGSKVDFVVLVRKDQSISKIGSLKDRKIITEKNDNGNLPLLWLETMVMREAYQSPLSFFSDHKEVNKASQAVMAVFFQRADACVVARSTFVTMSEVNPQIGKELKVLNHSPGYTKGIIAIRPGTREKFKGFVEDLLTIHVEPQAKQIFTLMKFNRFIPFDPAYLETTEALLREHKALKLKLAKTAR